MSDDRSTAPAETGSGPHIVRPAARRPGSAAAPGGEVPAVLDAVDHRILRLLAGDARMPNNAVAEAVGIAPSTCLGRVRALRASGAIRGFHADIDPAALGRPLQAMISVRLRAGARSRMVAFTDRMRSLPEVRDVYFLAGADDFLLHVAARDAAGLRDFVVDQLSAHAEVALTETNLIFDHLRGASPA